MKATTLGLSIAIAVSALCVTLAASPPLSEAKVVFSKAHVQLTNNAPYNLDLNDDGIFDFTFLTVFQRTEVCKRFGVYTVSTSHQSKVTV